MVLTAAVLPAARPLLYLSEVLPGFFKAAVQDCSPINSSRQIQDIVFLALGAFEAQRLTIPPCRRLLDRQQAVVQTIEAQAIEAQPIGMVRSLVPSC